MQDEFLFEFLSLSMICVIEKYKKNYELLNDMAALQLGNDLVKELPNLWDKVLASQTESIAKLKKLFVF